MRLQSQGADLKTQGVLVAAGKAVLVKGREHTTVEASETRIVGLTKTTVRGGVVGVRGDAVNVHADGLVDVRGTPIHLNC